MELTVDANEYMKFRNHTIDQHGASKNAEKSSFNGNVGPQRTIYNTEGFGELNGKYKTENGVDKPQRGHGPSDGLLNLGVSKEDLIFFNDKNFLRSVRRLD